MLLPRTITRRDWVRASSAGLLVLAADSSGLLAATPEVPETEDNQEGPFYKPGAPVRESLIDKGMPGTRLVLAGRVLGVDGRPLEGAELDFWQASAEGQYDNDGFILRGRLYSRPGGHYRLETVIPKHYDAGGRYPRPPHIHVKASKPGGPVLTTQLYFRGDRYNYDDASVRPSLLLDLENGSGGRQSNFDFVIRTR